MYAWCVTRIEPDNLEQWEAELVEPLPYQRTRTPVVTDEMIRQEEEDFMTLLNMQGGD